MESYFWRQRISRRRVVEAACTLGSWHLLRAQQRIGPPPHDHGPNVFLGYDQIELDAAYDQASYAPNQTQIQQRNARNSELTRARLGAPLRVSYGSADIEKIDIFRAPGPSAPIHIHIHGGAWRGGSARNSAYLAEAFVHAGAHLVIPDFAPVQDINGSLMAMEGQVRRAIAWIYKNAASFGGDANRIYLSGHSSGAHLAGCALIADWPRDYGIPAGFFKGALLVSGIYDLKAPRLSSRGGVRQIRRRDRICSEPAAAFGRTAYAADCGAREPRYARVSTSEP